MKLNDFKTKTIMKEENNTFVPGCWSIALDIGYSSVKCLCPNKTFSFPTFVKECEEDGLEIISPNSMTIKFRNEYGTAYDVGGVALELANIREVNENNKTMYGRDWYGTDTYRICLETALGLAVLSNRKRTYNNEVIYVITGLPCKYSDDSIILKSMLIGHHSFDLIPPNCKNWEHFELDVADALVMPQPMGALWAAENDNSCKGIIEENSFFKTNTVVFDGGFGTLDLYGLIGGAVSFRSTYRDCGMKEVFLRTVKEIKEIYDTDIPVPMLYKFLDDGKITYYKPCVESTPINLGEPDTFIRSCADITELFKNNSRSVAKIALKYLLRDTNHLVSYKYVVLSGGTAAAWSEYLTKAIAALGVKVVGTVGNNATDDLIFNNVRGYYYFMINTLRKEKVKKGEN